MAETLENQYLTFGIDGEIYGIPVSNVREVLEYRRPTKLPRTAAFLKGLINIRDVGIPVVDLRTKFGLPEKETTKETAILVMELTRSGEQLLIGAVADEVYEVIELENSHVEQPPGFGAGIDNRLIGGIGKHDGTFIVILNIDHAFSDDEGIMLENAAADHAASGPSANRA